MPELTRTRALESIPPEWIEREFGSPGAHWVGNNYFTKSPIDPNSGAAFVIKKTGRWIQGAGGLGGDLVDLISMRDNLSLDDAIAYIMGVDGVEVKDPSPKAIFRVGKKDVKPQIPIPTDAGNIPKALSRSQYATKRYGAPFDLWSYTAPEGQ